MKSHDGSDQVKTVIIEEEFLQRHGAPFDAQAEFGGLCSKPGLLEFISSRIGADNPSLLSDFPGKLARNYSRTGGYVKHQHSRKWFCCFDNLRDRRFVIEPCAALKVPGYSLLELTQPGRDQRLFL